MSNKQGCGFCSRHGLPILPVRTTVIEKTDSLPCIPSNIFQPAIAKGETDYTARLLREGFLHVYDEMINAWQDYYATEDGYFYPLPGNGDIPPSLLNGEMKPCITEPMELASASMITLPVMPAPYKNGKFWLSWSQTQWTPNIRKKHEDAAWRTKNMQCFDMDAWLNKGNAENVLPISSLTNTVAEYSPKAQLAEIKLYTAIEWKPRNPLAAANLFQASEILLPNKGAILVLQDPVAVLQDISSLITYRVNKNLYANPAYLRKLALSSSVVGLKESMTRQMARDILTNSAFDEARKKIGYTSPTGMSIMPSPALASDIYSQTNSTLKAKVSAKWADYAKYYNEDEVENFVAEFNGVVKKYDEEIVSPMTQLYIEWMKSSVLINHFIHNFDTKDIRSGMDYIQTVNYSIAGMQDKIATSLYFSTLLQGNTNDYNNILARALVLNQDKMSSLLDDSMQSSGDFWTKPWNGLADGFKDTFGSMQQQAAGYLGSFIGMCSGGISSLLHRAARSETCYHLFGMIAAHNHSAFITVSRTGTYEEFISEAVTTLARNARIAGDQTEDILRLYVDAEVRRLRIDGLPLQGTDTRRYIAMVDLKRFNELLALPEIERIQKLGTTLHSETEASRILFTRWQGKIEQGVQSIKHVTPFSWGVTSMVLQVAALWCSMDFSHVPMTEDQKESRNRFWAGTISLTGSTAGVVETGIEKFNKLGAAYRNSAAEKIAEWFGRGSRVIGAVGGVITAYYDAVHAADEWDRKRHGLFLAYSSSAISGGYLAFAPFINWAKIGSTMVSIGGRLGMPGMVSAGASMEVVGLTLGWVAIGVLLIAAFYLSYHEQSEIQQWLEKSLWGLSPEGIPPEKYPTMQIEMSALKMIMEGGGH